jgi:hypothetical protein
VISDFREGLDQRQYGGAIMSIFADPRRMLHLMLNVKVRARNDAALISLGLEQDQ